MVSQAFNARCDFAELCQRCFGMPLGASVLHDGSGHLPSWSQTEPVVYSVV